MTDKAPDRIYIRRDQMQNPSGVWSANDLRDVVPAIEYVRLPPGHVIVPVEPTQRMTDAAYAKIGALHMRDFYKAMIAAAQKPEKL